MLKARFESMISNEYSLDTARHDSFNEDFFLYLQGTKIRGAHHFQGLIVFICGLSHSRTHIQDLFMFSEIMILRNFSYSVAYHIQFLIFSDRNHKLILFILLEF